MDWEITGVDDSGDGLIVTAQKTIGYEELASMIGMPGSVNLSAPKKKPKEKKPRKKSKRKLSMTPHAIYLRERAAKTKGKNKRPTVGVTPITDADRVRLGRKLQENKEALEEKEREFNDTVSASRERE